MVSQMARSSTVCELGSLGLACNSHAEWRRRAMSVRDAAGLVLFRDLVRGQAVSALFRKTPLSLAV